MFADIIKPWPKNSRKIHERGMREKKYENNEKTENKQIYQVYET